MFQFPGLAPPMIQVTGITPSRVSPFGYPRINARLQLPVGFSQLATSFIAGLCLGIHHCALTYLTTILRLTLDENIVWKRASFVLSSLSPKTVTVHTYL